MALVAKDIMTTNVLTVGPDVDLLELDGTLRRARISGAPVTKNGKLVGIVSRSDIARQLVVEDTYAEVAYSLLEGFYGNEQEAVDPISDRVGERLRSMRVADAMVTAVDGVRPETPIVEVARRMSTSRHRRLVVTDAQGKLVGIVTASDLVRLVADGKLREV
jgi:CBS domain-containing protein